jgi:hypothetical protein
LPTQIMDAAAAATTEWQATTEDGHAKQSSLHHRDRFDAGRCRHGNGADRQPEFRDRHSILFASTVPEIGFPDDERAVATAQSRLRSPAAPRRIWRAIRG